MALTGLLIVWSVQERPTDPAAAVAATFVLLAVGQVAGSPAAGALVDHLGLAPAFLVASAAAAAGMAVLPAGRQRRRDQGKPFGGMVSTTGSPAMRTRRRAERRWRPKHTGGRAMSTPCLIRPLTPEALDALAHEVAAALDEGDGHRAWQLTQAAEAAANIGDHGIQPPAPVIGRRFARAHRHLLADATGPAEVAAPGEAKNPWVAGAAS